MAEQVSDAKRKSLKLGKIISVIKNCLDEWKRRRDAKQRPSGPSAKSQPDLGRPLSQESESDDSDYDTPRGREPAESRLRTRGPFDTPPPETLNQVFVNPQFLPEFVNGLSFNPGNPFTIMPGSPYEPLTALLNSDIAQTSTTQFKVTSSTRVENVVEASTSSSRQDDEEQVLGYNYNPNERIEKMFGINPTMWK